MAENFSVKLEEAKYYTPEVRCREQSWIGSYNKTYQAFLADPTDSGVGFADELEWFQPWDRVKAVGLPVSRFPERKLNSPTAWTDTHRASAHKVALIWRGGTRNESGPNLSPASSMAVCRFANGLSRSASGRGTGPCSTADGTRQVIAMLACASQSGHPLGGLSAGFGVERSTNGSGELVRGGDNCRLHLPARQGDPPQANR